MARLAIAGGKPVRTKPFARWPVFGDTEKAALLGVLESGVWGGYSPKVREFEEAFARFQETRYAVSASNGTVTLEAALLAGGIGPGDEVIVPPITFIATAAAVLRVGAVPVFADIGSDYNIDPSRIQEALSERSQAMIAVHFAGRPADMDRIAEIASKAGLMVIEDAAHAHGAKWKGGSVGNFSDIASFSFQESKNLTAGEGGILTGNNAVLIDAARSFFNQGRVPGGAWYEHENLGTNQRLTGWQAAVLLAQLERLPEQLARRAENATYLDEKLRGADFIEPLIPDLRVTRHSHYLYPIRLRLDRLAGINKDLFVKALTAEGIPGAGSYPHPLYENKVFQKYQYRRTECPEALRMCRESFWVSHAIMLAEPEDLDDFVSALSKVAANAAEMCSTAVH
jgi:dTDP-4-amino-4,6-dideoxygalactose transaminase